ncbi:MAG: peptidylprolyl isomerase [Alphaproteobacteria bacterium]
MAQTNMAFRFERAAALVGALVCCLVLAACSGRDGADKPPEPGDQAVARIDGRTVWVSDVKREAIAQGLIGEGEPLDITSDLFRRVMDEVVDQKLLAAEALKRKLDRDPAAQRKLAAARERILGDMLVESTVSNAVNENAIRGLYQEQLKLSKRSEEIHARQIVVATAPEAETIKKLLSTGASFEALAMEKSTDAATRFNGGDLGYFTTDVMPPAYEANLKTATIGQLVGPFAVDGGVALVKVEDRRLEQPITLEAARPQIIRFLTYDQVRDLLEKLRSRAKVQTLIKAPPEVPGAPKEPDSAQAVLPSRGQSAAEAALAAGPARPPQVSSKPASTGAKP